MSDLQWESDFVQVYIPDFFRSLFGGGNQLGKLHLKIVLFQLCLVFCKDDFAYFFTGVFIFCAFFNDEFIAVYCESEIFGKKMATRFRSENFGIFFRVGKSEFRQDMVAYNTVLCRKSSSVYDKDSPFSRRNILKDSFCRCFHKISGFLQQSQASVKMCNEARTCLCQLRNHPVADSVPQIIVFGIRIIFPERNVVLRGKIINFLFGKMQQRAQDPVACSGHAAQSLQAASSRKIDQKCFQLIVQMMCGDEIIQMMGALYFAKKPVTQVPCP